MGHPAGHATTGDALHSREDVIERKKSLREQADGLSKESRGFPVNSPERNQLYRVIQTFQAEQDDLELLLEGSFLPQHSRQQLISPRAVFTSPLFRVCSKKLGREKQTSLEMKNNSGQVVFRYTGPELRQSDGMVFMALLNLVRDVRAGEGVSFSAEGICQTVFGRYDGPTRNSLREHVKRLQRSDVSAV